jgi:WD40 repeat protein
MSDDRLTPRPALTAPRERLLGEEIVEMLGCATLWALPALLLCAVIGLLPTLGVATATASFGAWLGWFLIVRRRKRMIWARDAALPAGERPSLPPLPRSSAIATAPIPRPRVDRLGGHRRAIRGLALSPDGGHLASSDEEGAVIVHDLTTGFEVWAARDYWRSGVGLAYSADGRLLAATGVDPHRQPFDFVRTSVRIYDALNGRELRRIEFVTSLGPAVFLPDRRLLVAVATRLELWDPDPPSLERAVPSSPLSYLAGNVIAMDWRDGFVVLGYQLNERAYVIKLDDGPGVVSFSGHHRFFTLVREGEVGAVAVSPSGHLVLSGGLDGHARVWELRSGQQLTRFSGHWGWLGWHGVTGVGWLSDDEAISAGEDGALRRWDARTGREWGSYYHGARICRMALRGRMAATGAIEGSIRLWAL